MNRDTDTPRNLERRQTVTITVDLVCIGDNDPTANEITINGVSYDPRKLEERMKRGSWRDVDTDALYAAVETLAEWGAKPGDWEVV